MGKIEDNKSVSIRGFASQTNAVTPASGRLVLMVDAHDHLTIGYLIEAIGLSRILIDVIDVAMSRVIKLQSILVFELPKNNRATYSVEPKHGSKVVGRVVVFEGVCSKTELGESCAKEKSREKHVDSECGCINQYTQEHKKSKKEG